MRLPSTLRFMRNPIVYVQLIGRFICRNKKTCVQSNYIATYCNGSHPHHQTSPYPRIKMMVLAATAKCWNVVSLHKNFKIVYTCIVGKILNKKKIDKYARYKQQCEAYSISRWATLTYFHFKLATFLPHKIWSCEVLKCSLSHSPILVMMPGVARNASSIHDIAASLPGHENR
jgi:hypothetical protein